MLYAKTCVAFFRSPPRCTDLVVGTVLTAHDPHTFCELFGGSD